MISGWHCTATNVTVSFDGGAQLPAAVGLSRQDTRGVCGDDNNGFVLQFNWGILSDGAHSVLAFADGVQFGSATAHVVRLGESFLRGESAQCRVSQFPDSRTDTLLTWQESLQNFVIVDTEPTHGGAPNYSGIWRAFIDSEECGEAVVDVTISGSTLSAEYEDSRGTRRLSGEVASNGLLAGKVRNEGEFVALFTGKIRGDEADGDWIDRGGCIGEFHLERQ
jgi:hypothetical protein